MVCIFLSIGLLIGIGIGYSQYLWHKSSAEIHDLERIVDKYLIYQSNKEYTKAYDLHTEEYRAYDDLETYVQRSNYLRPATAGYMRNSLLLKDFFINFFVGQPITLVYIGYMLYEDRDQGYVTATFILKNNRWVLDGVNVSAPETRFDKYNPPQEKITPTP